MKRFSRHYFFLLFVTTLIAVQADSSLWAQESSGGERIFFNAKIFTGDAQNPYAEAVGIRGDMIIAVGNFPEVVRALSPNAERIDLEGRSLFPGFIDSHSHSIDGGLALISADASEKVRALNELAPFVEDAKKTGKGMRGDTLEILGLPLEFWSHCDALNSEFSTGVYEKQSVLLRGMDGHTAWANRALLQRAGITADFLKNLSAEERSYYGLNKDMQPNGFLVDAGTEKIEPLLPEPTPDRLLAAGWAALQYNYSLGITAWLDPLASDYVLQAYKLLADEGALTSQVVAFPQVLAIDPAAELAKVQKTREAYKNVPNLHVSGIKVFADGVVEYPSQTAHLTKAYKNTGRNGDLLFDPKKFAELCVAADKQGLIIHVHAIGDGAVKAALDGIAAARKANGNSGLPHTLTHEQFVLPEDFPRFRELGVVSALQLFWADASQDTIEIVKPYLDSGDLQVAISGALDPRQWRHHFRRERLAGFDRERVPGDLSGGDAQRAGGSARSVAGDATGSDVLCLHTELGPRHESRFHWNDRPRQARGSGFAGSRRFDGFSGGNARHQGVVDDGGGKDGVSSKVRRNGIEPAL